MATDQQLPRSSFKQLFQGALLDGLKLTSIIVPAGLVTHQVRQSKLANRIPPIGTTRNTTTTTPSSPSTPKINSLNHRITHFLKWNGLLTFGFSFVYAAVLASTSSLIYNNVRPLSTLNKVDKPAASQLTTRSSDYSIIGGTLGGSITATIFWNRRLLSLLSIIPGGIAIGVGAGLSTAYLQSLQARSLNLPRSPPSSMITDSISKS
ncbi:hypothetical protein VP01_3670g1 [Puccinia sorghi]|uniref:Uncharacterized protein n=1 Tax=Puccinia sorghi TaxID=27349 RepID=A0A0L6UUC9_9BASI|nr:hypothetical protein VP01_3670g1 [Puccinia sorghi]